MRWWVVGWRRGCASQLCQSSIRYLSQPALPARTLNQGGQTSLLSSSRTAPLALRHSTSSGPKRSRNVIRRQRDWAIRPQCPELVFFRLLLRRGSGSRPCPDSCSSRVRDLHSKPLGLNRCGGARERDRHGVRSWTPLPCNLPFQHPERRNTNEKGGTLD